MDVVPLYDEQQQQNEALFDAVPICKFLEHLNPFETDITMGFEEVGHAYTFQNKLLGEEVSSSFGGGSAPLMSVTGLVSLVFEKPDFKKIAERVFSNRDVMERKYPDCKSVEDILELWSAGATNGTAMHARFETLANFIESERPYRSPTEALEAFSRLSPFPELMYWKQIIRYFKLDQGARFYRTELKVCYEEVNCVGQIDCVIEVERDRYILVDWKRCKGGLQMPPRNPQKPLAECARASRGRVLPEFECLRNINSVTYGVQLSLYRRLFEESSPGKRIVGMVLVVIDSTRIGSEEALSFHEVPGDAVTDALTDKRTFIYDNAVNELFRHRAENILETYYSTLTKKAREQLQKIVNNKK